mmetsp:Transcript_19210/g.45286  ORF Transcript_19210/g.45286 Transcript_19210/m.45286 type:complete len:206 (-) Transcript_19210:154-771(-)
MPRQAASHHHVDQSILEKAIVLALAIQSALYRHVGAYQGEGNVSPGNAKIIFRWIVERAHVDGRVGANDQDQFVGGILGVENLLFQNIGRARITFVGKVRFFITWFRLLFLVVVVVIVVAAVIVIVAETLSVAFGLEGIATAGLMKHGCLSHPALPLTFFFSFATFSIVLGSGVSAVVDVVVVVRRTGARNHNVQQPRLFARHGI